MSSNQPAINAAFRLFIPVVVPSLRPCVMHDFFTAHFGLLNEYTNIQLSSILGFTTGYLLFSDVQQYALNEGYGLSAESQDAINIATTLWDLLTEAERQEWHDLARELAPIYEELNRIAQKYLESTFRAYHVREMAFQMMLNEPLQFPTNSNQELGSSSSSPPPYDSGV